MMSIDDLVKNVMEQVAYQDGNGVWWGHDTSVSAEDVKAVIEEYIEEVYGGELIPQSIQSLTHHEANRQQRAVEYYLRRAT